MPTLPSRTALRSPQQDQQRRAFPPPLPLVTIPQETTTLVLEGALQEARRNESALTELCTRLGVGMPSTETGDSPAPSTVATLALDLRNTQMRIAEMLGAALGQV